MPAKPFTFQSVQDTLRRQAMFNAEQPRYAPSLRALSWTPVIRESGAAPINIGAGGISAGTYVIANNVFTGWFVIQFGVGPVLGADTGWGLTGLPVQFAESHVGEWRALTSAGANMATGILEYGTVGTFMTPAYQFTWPTGVRTLWGFNRPFSWAVGDRITGQITARVADGFLGASP